MAPTTLAEAAQRIQGDDPPLRVAMRARGGGADRLTPLRYIGGFETKTLIYETLVKRGSDGRIAPGLASRWNVDADGRTFHFELREDARFHDGTLVTAEAVRVHFKRWVGLPEHDWLPANQRILDVQVESSKSFKVVLDQPYSLLADLCAINPCAIVGPSARDWEGEFLRPMGTGPFRFVAAQEGGKRWLLERVSGDGPRLEVVCYPRGRDTLPIEALRRGEIDAFVGGWDEDLPAESLHALAADERFRVQSAPGTSVVYLSFRMEDGPTKDLAVRRAIAAAIDRAALVTNVEGGRAEPCTAWAAPAIAFWPRKLQAATTSAPARREAVLGGVKLRIAANRREGRAGRVADAVAMQLRAAGFDAEIVVPAAGSTSRQRGLGDSSELTPRPLEMGTVQPLGAESGEARAAANRAQRAAADQADLRIEITHGSPYDPHQSLVARFGPTRRGELVQKGVDARLNELAMLVAMTPSEEQCMSLYSKIQELMDDQVLIVPLYAPWRVAIHSAGVDGIRLGPDVYAVDLTELRRVPAK